MAQLTAVNAIRFLVKRKFPDAERFTSLGSESGLSQEYRQLLSAIATYEKELSSKSAEDLPTGIPKNSP